MLLLDHPDMSIDDAYAIQAAWVQKKLDGGRKIIVFSGDCPCWATPARQLQPG